ncbi:MAG: prephenate dehydrogenase/arogenate dehydrogenase family protein [Planctomycetes bacterium]|nr:prephenate dehydrogenase/arogenate dehydrogenase family protein [Planctomycetota bacterium]
MAEENLDNVRERIRQIDLELVARAAERSRLVKQVGQIKRRLNISTVDYAQERAVLERARVAAAEHGLDPGVAEDLLARLIRASVTAQDQDSLRFSAAGAGKCAVIVGGAGRMGGWMSRFLSAQGFQAGSLDPAGAPEENEWARGALAGADFVVCSTPPAATAELYAAWAKQPPRGVVVDIASIKTPLIEPIRALQKAGVKVASIHPMFGPSAVLLRDADVVICDTGDAAASSAVEKLFLPTTANIVHLPLADHDRVMADLLSLAHATAIAFALALPKTEHPVRSTTFLALETLAAAVVRESPDVYYEIQSRNPYSAAAIERLRGAIDRVVEAISAKDSKAFAQLMGEGQARTPKARSKP